MAKLIGGTTVEGLLTVDSNIETDEGDVILDSSTNTIDLGVLPTGSGNGLDADLLDGQEASSLVDVAGDTMTGALNISGAGATVTGSDDAADEVLLQPGADTATTGTPSISLDVRGDIADGTTGIWNHSAGYLEQTALQNDSVTVTAGNQITGGGSVSLGGSITVAVDENNLDADTVDGYEAANLSEAQSSASFSSTDTTTDINKTSWTQIPWDVEKNIDAPYTHDATNTPEQITFDEAGTYQVYVSLGFESPNDSRTNPGIKFAINGTRRNAMGLSGYIRNASGHDEGSNSIMETISVTAGDTLTVQTYQYGNSGTVTMRSEESTLEISSITTRTISMSDADTLDGFHGADFLQSSGGTLTGNLNASDSINVTRGGSQMDSNNSIESNGDWLGLDSNSTGNGVLLGYYNAPEVRVGNGNLTDFNWNGDTVATRPWSNSNFYNEGQDLTGTSRVGGSGLFFDFDNNTSWIELVDVNSNRSDLVLGDIYVDSGNGWLSDYNLDDMATGGYDLQKNGTDGNGIINFKT